MERLVGLNSWGLTAGGRMWDPGGAGGIWAVGSVSGAQRGHLSWEGALGEPHFGRDRPGVESWLHSLVIA